MYIINPKIVEEKGWNLADFNIETNELSIIPIDIFTTILIKIISEHRYVISKKVSISNSEIYLEYDVKDYGKAKEEYYLIFLKELLSVIDGIKSYEIDFLKEISEKIKINWECYIGKENIDNAERIVDFITINHISKDFTSKKW